MRQVKDFPPIELGHRFGEQSDAEAFDETLRSPGAFGHAGVKVYTVRGFPAFDEIL